MHATGGAISSEGCGSWKNCEMLCILLELVQLCCEIQMPHRQDTKSNGPRRKKVRLFKKIFFLSCTIFCRLFETKVCRLIEELCTEMSFLRRNNKTKKEKIFKWDIIKVHAITHFSADIRRGGCTQEYSAEMFENLHQEVRVFIRHHHL